MSSVVLCSSIVIFLFVLISFISLATGFKRLGCLNSISTRQQALSTSPLISIVVPACNEEKHLKQAVLSLLNQKYEPLEIILVDDRSTDRTSIIMRELQNDFTTIKMVKITELPEDWMGKSNALAAGASVAEGEFLLFTDADVQMDSSVLLRAVNYIEQMGTDHLSLIFRNSTSGWLLNSLIIDSAFGFLLLFKPWKVRYNTNSNFIGVGAFNLIRKSVYTAIGGHESIKMHPIDDVMLGKLVKENGFSQDCLMGGELLCVPWYDSLSAMVDGLMKNAFALGHYRYMLVPLQLLIVAAVGILPFWGVLLGSWQIKIFSLLTLLLRCLQFYKALAVLRLPGRYLPGFLVSPYISCFIIFMAAYLTHKNDGVVWRGQHYPLKKLKKAKPLFY